VAIRRFESATGSPLRRIALPTRRIAGVAGLQDDPPCARFGIRGSTGAAHRSNRIRGLAKLIGFDERAGERDDFTAVRPTTRRLPAHYRSRYRCPTRRDRTEKISGGAIQAWNAFRSRPEASTTGISALPVEPGRCARRKSPSLRLSTWLSRREILTALTLLSRHRRRCAA